MRRLAFGLSALTFARRAISSGRLSPTFTLNVSTPGNELTMLSRVAASLMAGMVPLTFTEFRYNFGRGFVAASIAHASHGADSL